MTDEQRQAIVNVLRVHLRAVADLHSLSAILTDHQQTGERVQDWKEELQELQRTREYAARITEGEATITRVERVLAEDAADNLDELLRRLPTPAGSA
jgi:hypothetical protein